MDNHRQMPWHSRELGEVYQRLGTSEEGSVMPRQKKDYRKMVTMS